VTTGILRSRQKDKPIEHLKAPVRPLVSSWTFTEEQPDIDWDWKAYLLDQGMAAEKIPEELGQLDPGLFRRYILPKHRRRKNLK
jgi:hypothetical protein